MRMNPFGVGLIIMTVYLRESSIGFRGRRELCAFNIYARKNVSPAP